MTERDCVRYTIMVPSVFETDEKIQEELKGVIFDECRQAVIREIPCKCIIQDGDVLGYKEWKFTVPLHSAEAVFHRVAIWAEEMLTELIPGVDSIMLEKEFVKKVYLRQRYMNGADGFLLYQLGCFDYFLFLVFTGIILGFIGKALDLFD